LRHHYWSRSAVWYAGELPVEAHAVQTVVLDPNQLAQKTVTVVSQSQLATRLGIQPQQTTLNTLLVKSDIPVEFTRPEEQKIAQLTYDVIKTLENQPLKLPTSTYLARPEVQAEIVKAVTERFRPAQFELEGIVPTPDIAAVVSKTAGMIVQQTIDIPRILVVPTGEVKSGFNPFTLKLDALRYPAPSEELWIQHLRTNQLEILALGKGGIDEGRMEDYVVSGLVDFDDISYDDHADLLYDLSAQVVNHFRSYLSEDETRKVLRCYQRQIAHFIYTQMQVHYWEQATSYDVKITKGFTELKASAYTASAKEPTLDYRVSPPDKSNMAKYLFNGFQYCLYPVQKFQSDAERKLSVILEREKAKWFKPAKGQFQIFYKWGSEHPEYQPDFVAETAKCIYMLEPKASNQLTDEQVIAKREVAVTWCKNASDHAASCGGKPWKYALIPHDVISDNMTLAGLVERYICK